MDYLPTITLEKEILLMLIGRLYDSIILKWLFTTITKLTGKNFKRGEVNGNYKELR